MAGGVPGFNFGAFMAKAISEGVSMTAARQMMRDAGGAMSNQAFSSMFGQVRDAIGGRDNLAGMSWDALPGGEQYSTWTAGSGGRYATFVTTMVRRVGEREWEPRYFTHISTEPHTIQEAVDAAAARLDSGVDNNPAYGAEVRGPAFPTSITRTVAR